MDDDRQKINPSLRKSDGSYVKSVSETDQQLLPDDMRGLTKLRESFQKNNKEHIRMCNFICHIVTVYFGAIQFGILISMWNVAWKPFAFQNDLSDNIEGDANKESYEKNVIVQSVTTIGCAIGALCAGFLVKFGRWNCLIMANLLNVAGCVLQIFYTNFAVFNVGRIIYGVAVGGFSVFSNQYVSEIAPQEVSGPAGSLFQVLVVCGGLIPTGFGLVKIDESDKDLQKTILTMLVLTPAVLSGVQLLLLLLFFRIDTPIYYNQKGDGHKVREALKYMYKPYAVENKAMEIMQGGDNSELKDPDGAYPENDDTEIVSYKDIFCNSQYYKATFIGLLLTVFQQMTGVNIIYFYSNQILGNVGIDSGISTFLIQGVSVFGVFSGMVMTGYLGRKTIMFVFSLVMAAFLIGLGISLQIDSGKIPIVLVSGFCFTFQASSGPVTWLYMAEVMQEKGLSIGTVLNWLFTLLMSFITPTIKNAFGITGVGYLFIIVGAFTVGAAIFILIFLKETKGKSLAERKALYATNKIIE